MTDLGQLQASVRSIAACVWLTALVITLLTPPVARCQEEPQPSYDPVGKRDPFVSPYSLSGDDATVSDVARTPLQRFELGQLKLVGVIWETTEPKALIEDNAGLGYIVTAGTLIGSKGGVIKNIEQKRVIVEEYETDFYGERQVLKRELLLVVADSEPEGTDDSAE